MASKLNNPSMLPVICVLGSWSSGTTAVTGYLARMGCYSCPPHFQTNDPRTPDSHESLALRNECVKVVSEQSLQLIGDVEAFSQWLSGWLQEQSESAKQTQCSHIVLKHPLLSFLIEPVAQVCSPKWVLVTRPLEDIERTRARRGWGAVHGEAGARTVYSAAFSSLMSGQKSFHAVAFDEFRQNAKARSDLVRYLEIESDQAGLADAEAWLR